MQPVYYWGMRILREISTGGKSAQQPSEEVATSPFTWPDMTRCSNQSVTNVSNLLASESGSDRNKSVWQQLRIVCGTLSVIVARLHDEPRTVALDVDCLSQALRAAAPMHSRVVRGDTAFRGIPAIILDHKRDDKLYWWGFPNTLGIMSPGFFTADRRIHTARGIVRDRWDAANIIGSLLL